MATKHVNKESVDDKTFTLGKVPWVCENPESVSQQKLFVCKKNIKFQSSRATEEERESKGREGWDWRATAGGNNEVVSGYR